MKNNEAPDLPTEMIEGKEAFRRFDALMSNIVTVPHKSIVKGWKAYRRKVRKNPSTPGPKPKNIPPA